MSLKIYTDGSCRGNGQVNSTGAWGYVVLDEQEEIITTGSGFKDNTTNQRMELMAAAQGLYYISEHSKYKDAKVEVYTDSAYLHNCVTQKWYVKWRINGWKNSKKEPVANRDLWELLINYFDNKNITFHKVDAHKDNKWNNYVDNMVQTLSAKVG